MGRSEQDTHFPFLKILISKEQHIISFNSRLYSLLQTTLSDKWSSNSIYTSDKIPCIYFKHITTHKTYRFPSLQFNRKSRLKKKIMLFKILHAFMYDPFFVLNLKKRSLDRVCVLKTSMIWDERKILNRKKVDFNKIINSVDWFWYCEGKSLISCYVHKNIASVFPNNFFFFVWNENFK